MSDLCGFQIFFGVDFDSVFYYFDMSALMRPDIVSMSTMIHHSFWFCRGGTISTR